MSTKPGAVPFVLDGITLSMTARVVSSHAGPDEKLTAQLTEEVIEEVIGRAEAAM